MSETEAKGIKRRDMLRLAGVAPVAMVATGAEASEPAIADPASDKMQDTAHTRAYLASARF